MQKNANADEGRPEALPFKTMEAYAASRLTERERPPFRHQSRNKTSERCSHHECAGAPPGAPNAPGWADLVGRPDGSSFCRGGGGEG